MDNCEIIEIADKYIECICLLTGKIFKVTLNG
jgi:hypothetical protein